MRLILLLFTLAAVWCLPSVHAQRDAFQSAEDAAARVIVGPKGVTEEQATTLSTAYFYRCIGWCGYADDPVEHADHWSARAFVGYGGALRGSIRVSKATGQVSFPGKPTLLPKDFATPAPKSP